MNNTPLRLESWLVMVFLGPTLKEVFQPSIFSSTTHPTLPPPLPLLWVQRLVPCQWPSSSRMTTLQCMNYAPAWSFLNLLFQYYHITLYMMMHECMNYALPCLFEIFVCNIVLLIAYNLVNDDASVFELCTCSVSLNLLFAMLFLFSSAISI